ncbi:uncharacterized protein LOC143855452 [Tasmannia lanceolata]|uniref:uncharacterized protein LOC143855452 n=1 Tax=Tasmannia lanceolata TaxID=3420 RepID=UPI0040641C04
MTSKTLFVLGIFLATFLLISSEVAARELAEETNVVKKDGVEDAKYGGGCGYNCGGGGGGYGHGGGGGGYGRGGGGGYGRGGGGGYGRGGGGGGCHCCGSYGCRCCMAGQVSTEETEAKPHN